jgi:cytochrome P450
MTTRTASPGTSPDTGTPIPRDTRLALLRGLLAIGGLRRDMLSGFCSQYERLGPVVAPSGSTRFVHFFGPDANRFVLLDQTRIFSARRPWMGIMGQIFPNGLLLLDGEEHKRDRRIMHEPFAKPALREYAERMNPMIASSLAQWAGGGELLMYPRFKALTLDIAAQIFIGMGPGSAGQEMNRAFSSMVAASMSRIRLRIPGLEFDRGLRGRDYMRTLLKGMIPSKRAEPGKDMFSRLCAARDEEGNTFSDQRVQDHMVFLMMAAHDTTTSTLTSMVYELGRDAQWQERLREESHGLGREQIGAEDVDALTGISLVMRETLRRYPPLPVIPRVALEPFEFRGHRIPAGAMVVLAPIHTHHMSEWWSDPFRFDPLRFSPERAEDQRHSHSWVPFGGGAHTCLGKRFAEIQIAAVMHQLLLRYRWSVPEGYRMPVQQAPISRPVDGLPVLMHPLERS